MRKIAEFKNEIRKTTVKYNSEFREYQVALFENGALVPGASYYTDGKADAIATAEMMIKPNDVQANEMKKYNGIEELPASCINGVDEPSCPKCAHYNAMLHVDYFDGVTTLQCRDCGHKAIHVHKCAAEVA